mgnify:CR=1 FL=1
MKIVGLITEYNPFHNGHKYHIEQAKKITGLCTKRHACHYAQTFESRDGVELWSSRSL